MSRDTFSYVTRENRCVHMLSTRNGMHLGVVVKDWMDSVDILWDIACHSDSMSLIVIHKNVLACILNIFSRLQ